MARSNTPIANALKSGISLHQQEVIVERPDGSRVTVCVHIDPIRDGNGKIMGVVNFLYDVNERNKEEHKLSGLKDWASPPRRSHGADWWEESKNCLSVWQNAALSQGR
jgi:hypothetical protein